MSSSVDQGPQEAPVGIAVTPLVDDGLGNTAHLADFYGLRAAVGIRRRR